jgi:hypothetical protein
MCTMVFSATALTLHEKYSFDDKDDAVAKHQQSFIGTRDFVLIVHSETSDKSKLLKHFISVFGSSTCIRNSLLSILMSIRQIVLLSRGSFIGVQLTGE